MNTLPDALPLIRAAEPRDLPAVVGLIHELAEFESLTHLFEATPEELGRHLFAERPSAECLVAQQGETLVGFALFFTTFSTFKCKPSLYLEDLYVQPSQRGNGLGKRLLKQLGALAVARDYGRFEWCVLDWNTNAIAFYEKMGAALLPDWRLCRLSGDALQAFAAPA